MDRIRLDSSWSDLETLPGRGCSCLAEELHQSRPRVVSHSTEFWFPDMNSTLHWSPRSMDEHDEDVASSVERPLNSPRGHKGLM